VSSDVYVVFCNDDGNWWSPFLHPFIKHCYILKQDRGVWVVVEQTTTLPTIYTTTDIDAILNSGFVIKVKPKERRGTFFMFNTCVGHAKQAIGISNPFILTPWQLLNYLRKENEQSIKETKGTEEDSAGSSSRAPSDDNVG
jgi:hypothetical protein